MKVISMMAHKEKLERKTLKEQAGLLETNLLHFNTAWECICALPENMVAQLIQKAKRHGLFNLRDLTRKFEEGV